MEDLLLGRRAELSGAPRSLGRAHGESFHEEPVATPLVALQFVHITLRKGCQGFHPVLQLLVTEILQEVAHLQEDNHTVGGMEGHHRGS